MRCCLSDSGLQNQSEIWEWNELTVSISIFRFLDWIYCVCANCNHCHKGWQIWYVDDRFPVICARSWPPNIPKFISCLCKEIEHIHFDRGHFTVHQAVAICVLVSKILINYLTWIMCKLLQWFVWLQKLPKKAFPLR